MLAKRRLNMAAPMIISAWAILHIRTGDVQVNDNGITTWKRFSRYWSSVRGIHRLQANHIVRANTIIHDPWKFADQTVDLHMIWDTSKLMSRYHNGAWAGFMWSIL